MVFAVGFVCSKYLFSKKLNGIFRECLKKIVAETDQDFRV